jgi:hypothetical protein
MVFILDFLLISANLPFGKSSDFKIGEDLPAYLSIYRFD